jgi:hypothetical protein
VKTLSLLDDSSNFEPLFSIMLRGGEVCEVTFRAPQIVLKSALFPSGDNFSFVSRNRRDKRREKKPHNNQNLNFYWSAVNPLCCWCSCKIKPQAVSSEQVTY